MKTRRKLIIERIMWPLAVVCVTVGSLLASAAAGASSGWSSPAQIDGAGVLSTVSCPSASFCVAVDGAGNALTYNGSSWSTPAKIYSASPPSLVSCPSASFCVAVGWHYSGKPEYVTYNGSSWSAPATINDSATKKWQATEVSSVSCVSASFCVAVDDAGNALTYDGKSWSAPAAINSYDSSRIATMAVSCPTASFCAVVDQTGYVVTYNGSSWSAPAQIHPEAGLVGEPLVSCSSASFCAVVLGGQAVTYNGSSWSAPAQIDPVHLPEREGRPTTSVSCPSASFCAVVDDFGNALNYNGSSWSAPAQIDSAGWLHSVSCPSASFCAAVGGEFGVGWALTYSPSSANAPPTPLPAPAIKAARMTNKRFRVARWATAISARKAPLGTTFQFTLSAAAKLTIAITRSAQGLRHGPSCLAPTAKLRRGHAKHCTRTITVARLTRSNEPAAADRISFSGRVGHRALSPRGYKATLIASNAGGSSKPVTLSFTVVR